MEARVFRKENEQVLIQGTGRAGRVMSKMRTPREDAILGQQ